MRVKNDSGSTQIWVGQELADQAEYDIQAAELHKWQANDKVNTDLGSLDLLIGDGTTYKTTSSEALNYLLGADTDPKDSEGRRIYSPSPFADSGGFRARFKGINGTATKNTITNIDYKLTEDRYINGVRLMINNHVYGDYVDFQVVDVDNILGYGAGTVLDEFGSTWYLDPNICTQPDVVVPYPAKVLKDLYIRVKYTSVGTSNDVDVKVNLYLHKKTV